MYYHNECEGCKHIHAEVSPYHADWTKALPSQANVKVPISLRILFSDFFFILHFKLNRIDGALTLPVAIKVAGLITDLENCRQVPNYPLIIFHTSITWKGSDNEAI